MTVGRLTTLPVEVLADVTTKGRLTSLYAEVPVAETPVARVTGVHLEVLTDVATSTTTGGARTIVMIVT